MFKRAQYLIQYALLGKGKTVLTLTLNKHSKERHSALKGILLFILCAECAFILTRTSRADDK